MTWDNEQKIDHDPRAHTWYVHFDYSPKVLYILLCEIKPCLFMMFVYDIYLFLVSCGIRFMLSILSKDEVSVH